MECNYCYYKLSVIIIVGSSNRRLAILVVSVNKCSNRFDNRLLINLI